MAKANGILKIEDLTFYKKDGKISLIREVVL